MVVEDDTDRLSAMVGRAANRRLEQSKSKERPITKRGNMIEQKNDNGLLRYIKKQEFNACNAILASDDEEGEQTT